MSIFKLFFYANIIIFIFIEKYILLFLYGAEDVRKVTCLLQFIESNR